MIPIYADQGASGFLGRAVQDRQGKGGRRGIEVSKLHSCRSENGLATSKFILGEKSILFQMGGWQASYEFR